MNNYNNLNPPPRGVSRTTVIRGVLISLLVILGFALVFGIFGLIAFIQNVSGPANLRVNHGNVPDVGDQWLFSHRDTTNRAHSSRTQITAQNVKSLVKAFEANIGQDPSLGGNITGAFRADINWGSVTVDRENIYLATVNNRFENGTQIFGTPGHLMAFNRNTGVRIWNKAVTSFSLDNTGAQFDTAFQAAPAIHGDYLYIGTKQNRPQTYASAPHQTVTNPQLFGFPTAAKNVRTHIYCINKHTGDEVWVTEIGQTASTISDPDNFLYLSMSPIVFDLDPAGGNNKIPVVAIGTSSSQSFVPDFMATDETTTKGYNAIGGYGYGTAPITRMTDVGRLVLLNGINGSIISTTMNGPPLYTAGSTLLEDSVVYDDSSRENGDMQIWHLVYTADIMGGGELNPIAPQYGKSLMIISIMPGATIVAGSPLVGLTVRDNTGALVTIAAGAAPANLDYVTVKMDVTFMPGTQLFSRDGPLPGPAPYNVTTADLDGAGGNVRARIVKNLRVGDTLTDQDAYECNYYGASAWGSNPSINYDRFGNAVELYYSVGQAHKIPYDEMKRFDVAKASGEGATPIETLYNIKQKQDDFAGDKTLPKLDAIREAFADRLKDIEVRRNVPVSPRSKRFFRNSIVAINLRPGHIGEVVWTKKIAGYDTWRVGLVNDAQRNILGVGIVPGFTNIKWHHGTLRGHDSDYGESPYYCPGCGRQNEDLIVAPNKGGLVSVMNLSDVNNGPTTITEKTVSILNSPGLLGGSNYGSTVVGNLLLTVQANDVISFGAVDTTFNDRSFPPLLEYYPQLETDPATITPFKVRQSYLSAYDFVNDKIVYEIPLLTGAEDTYATVTALSSGRDLVYVQPNNQTMQIRNAYTGALVHTITIDSAGVSNLAVLDRELVICNGREGFFGDNPFGTNYKSAKYLYKYRLP